MTPQAHADHLLQVWQSRRHLKPIYRLADCPPPLVPCNDNKDEYERDLDVLHEVLKS